MGSIKKAAQGRVVSICEMILGPRLIYAVCPDFAGGCVSSERPALMLLTYFEFIAFRFSWDRPAARKVQYQASR